MICLQHIEIRQTNDTADAVKGNRQKSDSARHAHAVAQKSRKRAERDHIAERVKLNAEQLFIVCAVCFPAGNLTVEHIEKPRKC